MKMGGTGSKQEDQIITAAIEKATGTKFIYVPFKGGGEVAVQLVGKHVDSTVNNPIEAVAQWRANQVRALCVFDEKRMPYKDKITDSQAWGDVPTCSEAGIPTNYTMLRGIFMAPGVTKEQTQYYVDLLKKVRETPEWKDYMNKGAFNQTSMDGEKFTEWLGRAEQTHRELMKDNGWLAK
jgi:tripartite-type tricarboxylate transporter receptor subunit TctC